MFGVPAHLDLEPFVAARLINVGVGLWNTLFVFEIATLSYGEVNAEGRWEVLTGDGGLVGSRSREARGLSDVPFDQLLGATVTGFVIAAPTHFDLALSTGVMLRFHDDSNNYESVTITPGDYVI